jgi:hypothetical protein
VRPIDTLILEHEDGLDRNLYLVAADLRVDLMDELRLTRLFTAMTKRGTQFLWPVKLPLDGNAQRAWSASAIAAAEETKTLWVKLVGDKGAGAYRYIKATGDLGEPQWQDKSLGELLQLAFKERYIGTLEHEVLRDLRGEI